MRISRPTRGGYRSIEPFSDRFGVHPDARIACGHPDHWKWGKGTRNGQKLYYLAKEMYVQNYEMTDREMNEAIEGYDMFSLEMKPRILCSHCATHEMANHIVAMMAEAGLTPDEMLEVIGLVRGRLEKDKYCQCANPAFRFVYDEDGNEEDYCYRCNKLIR